MKSKGTNRNADGESLARPYNAHKEVAEGDKGYVELDFYSLMKGNSFSHFPGPPEPEDEKK